MAMSAKLAFAVTFAAAAGVALAEGPGTRIRTTAEVPQPMTLATPQAKEAGPSCERLSGERRERCLAELKQAGIERRPSGPEATGMGSGAGSGGTTGTSGGASLAPGTPR
jgi:hypothetical protein